MGNWGMGKEEGTRCDQHWVLQATDESLNTTLKLIVYTSWLNEFLKIKKKKNQLPSL